MVERSKRRLSGRRVDENRFPLRPPDDDAIRPNWNKAMIETVDRARQDKVADYRNERYRSAPVTLPKLPFL